MNGDDILDIVAANRDSRDVSVLIGVGNGTFDDQTTFPVGGEPWYVTMGDVNGDGVLDVVTPDAESASVAVFLGQQAP